MLQVEDQEGRAKERPGDGQKEERMDEVKKEGGGREKRKGAECGEVGRRNGREGADWGRKRHNL